jgi:hypothetical protein
MIEAMSKKDERAAKAMYTKPTRYYHTRYHSQDWECLVELGWVTSYVFVNPNDGVKIAIMVKE